MTDDRVSNPSFAFIPKNVWDVVLDVAPVPLGSIALWFSVLFVIYLVDWLPWSTEKLGPVRFAIENEILIPTATAVGIALYFLVDGLFQRRERAGGLDSKGFGRSRLLVVSATIIVAMLAIIWCLYAIYADWWMGWPANSVMASARLGGAWTVATVTALGLRRLDKRFEAICLLPPIACLVATLLDLVINTTLTSRVMMVVQSLQVGRRSLIALPGLLVLVTIGLSVCALPVTMWAERRLFNSHRRTVGIACAGLWVLAAATATMEYWFHLLFH